MLGELGGRLVRAARGGANRSPSVRAGARAMGNFVFWASTAVGLVIAVAILDDEALDDLGQTLGDNVPKFLLALVMLIVGYGVAVAVAAAVGQSAKRASGVRQRNLERFLRLVIMVAATAVALTQIGVGSGTLAVLLAVLVGAPALALALLSAMGGRDVAGHLAAGRALRHQLREGWTLAFEPSGEDRVVGRIVEMHPTSVEIELPDGARLMVPNRSLLESPFSVRP
jgi:small-conductance mechanosensitive channel